MEARPPRTKRLSDARVELVPAHVVGAPELEDPPRDVVAPHRLREERSNVIDPDRLHPALAPADDRRRRQPTHLPHEGRQYAAVTAEHERRPEDHVRDPGALDRPLHLPLRAVVRSEILRLLADAGGAHLDPP